MAKTVRFWVDPICPWCWVTALWARSVADERELNIVWKPISLLIKNETQPDSPFFERVSWTLGLLRVMEAVRAVEGDGPIESLYFEYGRRIHHDQESLWDPAEALVAVGLDAKFADAATDESWDAVVRAGMDEGLAMVGADVGTPIIAFADAAGVERAAFGPVITRVPTRQDSLKLWDAFETLTALDGFWELKRTRTERPDFGVRP